MKKQRTKSPIKLEPLRSPGESAERRADDIFDGKIMPLLSLSIVGITITALEWYREYSQLPPLQWAWAWTIVTAGIISYTFYRTRPMFKERKRLILGSKGEKSVGQRLEQLREVSAKIIHDFPGEGFNIDHIVIHKTGVYAIETKTYSKPAKGETVINYDGKNVRVNGKIPDRNPITQVNAAANWLERCIHELTDKKFMVKPVVLFPDWYVQSNTEGKKSNTWALNPKGFPIYIKNASEKIHAKDVNLIDSCLAQYARSKY